MMHPAELEPAELLKTCDVRRQRRSGPGGQHRNKVETGVILLHRATGVRAEATERRSQHENQSVAIGRLRVNLALQVRSAPPRSSGVSLRWSARVRGKRIQVNVNHPDFPVLLAEALDVIDVCEYDLRAAAERLDVTPSQLTRFLKLEPRALEAVNRQRETRGFGRLR